MADIYETEPDRVRLLFLDEADDRVDEEAQVALEIEHDEQNIDYIEAGPDAAVELLEIMQYPEWSEADQ